MPCAKLKENFEGQLLFQSTIRGIQLLVFSCCYQRLQLSVNRRRRYSALWYIPIEMKYFEEVSAKLHWLGIFHCNPDPKSKWIVVAKRCGLFITYTSLFPTSAWYLVFEAQTPRENSESLLFVLIASLILVWYSAFLFQHEKYAALIDELISMIEKSKSHLS